MGVAFFSLENNLEDTLTINVHNKMSPVRDKHIEVARLRLESWVLLFLACIAHGWALRGSKFSSSGAIRGA